MALSTDTTHPIVVKQGEANWWGVVDLDIRTPITEPPSVVVTLQARQLAPESETQLYVAAPQFVTYAGPRLLMIMGDAMLRGVAMLTGGATPDQAIYRGIRDALYAALQADGQIPSEAK